MLRRHARANGYRLDIFYTHSESEAIVRLYRAAAEGLDAMLGHLRAQADASSGSPRTRTHSSGGAGMRKARAPRP